MVRAMILGYYGYGNVGDEAILGELVKWLQETDLVDEIVVLSANPRLTSARLNVRAIHRYRLDLISKELIRSSVLVGGGGSLIQDQTSVRSSLYYLSILAAAILLKRKVAVVGQGIGPLNSGLVRKLARAVFTAADYVSLRDQGSIELLKEIGVPEKRVRLTADLAFLSQRAGLRLTDPAVAERGPIVLVVPHGRASGAQSNWPATVIQTLEGFLRNRSYQDLVVTAFQRGDSVRLADGAILYPPAASPESADQLVRSASVVISARLHGLILAVRAGVPCIAVGSDPKIRHFAREAGLPWIDPASPPSAVADAVLDRVQAVLGNYAAVSESVKLSSEKMRERAEAGMAGLYSLLKSLR